MKRLANLAVASCLVVFVASAFAAPPKRADLPANPAWVLHVDCDALRQTYLGRYILYQLDKPEMYSNMMAFRSIFSFDFRTQLHGFTVYGNDSNPQDSVAIMYGDFEPAHLIALTQAADSPKAITNNHHVIYSWNDKKQNPDAGEGPRTYAVIQKDRMIKTLSEDAMLAALAVMDGKTPRLSDCNALPELSAAGETIFIQGTSRNLDFLGSGTNAALLKMAKRAKIQAGEESEQFKAVLTLEAGDESTARQMSIAAQGLIALASLQKGNSKGAQMARDITVKQTGSALTITLSLPSAELIADIKANMPKKEAQKSPAE